MLVLFVARFHRGGAVLDDTPDLLYVRLLLLRKGALSALVFDVVFKAFDTHGAQLVVRELPEREA